MPTGATVALFTDPRNANAATEAKEIEAAAEALGVRLLVLNASSPSELDVAFERIAQQNVSGFLNAADPFIVSQRDRIVALAARRAIPGVYSARPYFEAGGLIYYGPATLEEFRTVGIYVGRILKGEAGRPARAAIHEGRTRHQSQSGEGSQDHNSNCATCPRRRGDRVKRRNVIESETAG